MKEIANRSAITVLPKKPFNEWARHYNGLTEEELEERLSERHIYLIDWFMKPINIFYLLEPYWLGIFEHELSSWNFYDHEWPQNRDIKMFLEWFEVKLNDDLFDLETEPIIKEDV